MKWLVALVVICTVRVGSASAPVKATLTGCVLDGTFITTDGGLLVLTAKPPVDLAAYAGKKLRVTGLLSPGDRMDPTAPIVVLGACPADEKLAMLPVLARVYREAMDGAVRPATKPGKRAEAIDCAERTCYQLLRVPKAGGRPLVVRSAHLIGHVFVDKDNVYWSEGEIRDWDMMKLPKARLRDRPTSVAKGQLRGDMVRGPHGFYGIVDAGLVALEDGKPPRVLVPDAGAEVAIDADRLYYVGYGPENSGSIVALPLAGGPPQTLAISEPVPTTPFVAHGELYWSNINVPPLGGGQILRVSVGGGVRTPVVDTLPKMTPWALTADARFVYWVEWGASGYEVYRAPRAGGDRTLLGIAATKVMNRDNRDHVEVDATHVYWNARESIARVEKAGGPVDELVRLARGDVMSFAMDDTYLWVAVVIF